MLFKNYTKDMRKRRPGFLLELQNFEIEEEINYEEVLEKREEEDLPMIRFLLNNILTYLHHLLGYLRKGKLTTTL